MSRHKLIHASLGVAPADPAAAERTKSSIEPSSDGGKSSPSSSMTTFQARRSAHGDLVALGTLLAVEFSGRVSAGTVIRVVARTREQLLAAGVRAGLVIAVESMARAQLEQLSPEPADDGGACPAPAHSTHPQNPRRVS